MRNYGVSKLSRTHKKPQLAAAAATTANRPLQKWPRLGSPNAAWASSSYFSMTYGNVRKLQHRFRQRLPACIRRDEYHLSVTLVVFVRTLNLHCVLKLSVSIGSQPSTASATRAAKALPFSVTGFEEILWTFALCARLCVFQICVSRVLIVSACVFLCWCIHSLSSFSFRIIKVFLPPSFPRRSYEENTRQKKKKKEMLVNSPVRVQ